MRRHVCAERPSDLLIPRAVHGRAEGDSDATFSTPARDGHAPCAHGDESEKRVFGQLGRVRAL